MGKRAVRIVVVRKAVSIFLLLVLTVLMAALVYALSGKAYVADSHPVRELVSRLIGSSRGPVTRGAVLAFLMPVIANMLLFVPWGFLAFVSLDTPERARRMTYAAVFSAALLFAGAMYVWQQFLPTRVTALHDALANGAGALAGAAMGHARKTVRVRFEF